VIETQAVVEQTMSKKINVRSSNKPRRACSPELIRAIQATSIAQRAPIIITLKERMSIEQMISIRRYIDNWCRQYKIKYPVLLLPSCCGDTSEAAKVLKESVLKAAIKELAKLRNDAKNCVAWAAYSQAMSTIRSLGKDMAVRKRCK